MEIGSHDLTAHVLLEPTGESDPVMDAIQVIGEVVGAGLVGVNRELWYERETLLAFAREIVKLHEARQDVVELSSLSPGEFDLRLQAHPRTREVFASVRMKKVEPGSGFCHSLVTGFDVDPETLLEAAEDLQVLISGS